jgi:predicted O-linked N-acetylglucosamine transferase (SPINDLY family)
VTVHSDNIFKRAMALLHGGKIDEAERAFRGLLKEQPRHVGALNLLSIVLVQQGKFAKAEPFIKRALDENPSSDATLYNYGIILKALDRPAEALERFSEALAINPAVAETWNSRGTVFNELGRYEEAIADFDKALSIEPNLSAAYCNKGRSFGILKLYDQALNAYDKALTLNPQMTEAWGGRGNILSDLKQYHKALDAFDKAQSLNPNSVESWSGRGGALYGLNQVQEALSAYDKALALNPNLVVAWIGRGNAFEKLRQFDDAAAAYDVALRLKPDLAGAWLGRGNINFKQRRLADALADYDRALALEPDYAEALISRGNINFKQRRLADALAEYDRALALEPDYAEALIGRGNVLSESGLLDQASAEFNKILSLQPNLADAWQGQGGVFVKKKQYADAFAAYDRAYAIMPDLQYLEGIRLHTKQYICDWSNMDAETSHLVESIREQKPASAPFVLLSIASSSDTQLQCAKHYAADQLSSSSLPWRGKTRAHDRIRVAYISSDLREHPVAWLIADVFDRHDKSRFELTAISLGGVQESAIRARIKGAVEHFIDAQSLEDDQIADYIHQREIDILVDLNGHTDGARHGVLVRRPAPIQINYLGYPGTMGAEYIDYIIADRTVIPADDQHNFSEKIIYMPDSFQANDLKGHTTDKVFTHAQAGLPPDGFVFCCFNSNYKIMPEVFDLWLQILRQVEGAVLWLYVQNLTAQNNLLHEAATRGIAPDRLIFASSLPLSEHQSRLPLADLFLDTLPFNAGATASGALSAGVPVLTRVGNTFSGRMGASLLKALGLPELITSTAESYVSMAVELAMQPAKMAAIKRRLADNIGSTPLFDTQRFTRHLESAYLTIHAQHQRGEPPHTFDVEAATQNPH